MFDDGNTADGYFADATSFYGPTAGALARAGAADPEAGDQDTLSTTPVAGPVEANTSARRFSARAFVRSPVGWLLILLALAYVAFDHVFGQAS